MLPVSMSAFSAIRKLRWFERFDSRDEREGAAANGALIGPNGCVAWKKALLTIAVFLILMNTSNTFSAVSDASRQGRVVPFWHFALWEASSAFGALAACPVVGYAIKVARPGQVAWRKALSVHFAASIIYSLVHVGLMVALRFGVHAFAGETYRFQPSELLYEYRKDAVAYLIFAAVFWYFSGVVRRESKAHPEVTNPADSEIAIPQGAGFVRVPAAMILTVKSAGNYVEYELSDSRVLLVRAAMRKTAEELRSFGFVRTHRSWLVNRYAVSEVMAREGGDHEIRLKDGRVIPIARRYRSIALAELRPV